MSLPPALPADQLRLDCLTNEDRHAVWTGDCLDTAALLVCQADLGLFDVHRRAPHSRGAIRPRNICQRHSFPSPLIDELSVPGYISGDAYGDKHMTQIAQHTLAAEEAFISAFEAAARADVHKDAAAAIRAENRLLDAAFALNGYSATMAMTDEEFDAWAAQRYAELLSDGDR